MSDWQRADFGSDLLIPERNLSVSRNCSKAKAFNDIAVWVREQGIAIGDGRIINVSFGLYELWQRIPDGKERLTLKKVGFTQLPDFQYE